MAGMSFEADIYVAWVCHLLHATERTAVHATSLTADG